MIAVLKPFTMRGVRYGPPGRPDFYRAQLLQAEAKLAELDSAWAADELSRSLRNPEDAERAARGFQIVRADQLSVIARLTAAVAEEELPSKQIVPKAEWDKLPKYKQRNFLAARLVQQREGRKLQEA